MYMYTYVYIYIYIYMSWLPVVPLHPPTHPMVMVHLVMPPLPVGCGVDRGGAPRMHR